MLQWFDSCYGDDTCWSQRGILRAPDSGSLQSQYMEHLSDNKIEHELVDDVYVDNPQEGKEWSGNDNV